MIEVLDVIQVKPNVHEIIYQVDKESCGAYQLRTKEPPPKIGSLIEIEVKGKKIMKWRLYTEDLACGRDLAVFADGTND